MPGEVGGSAAWTLPSLKFDLFLYPLTPSAECANSGAHSYPWTDKREIYTEAIQATRSLKLRIKCAPLLTHPLVHHSFLSSSHAPLSAAKSRYGFVARVDIRNC
jgi:hypothetical protein